MEESRFRFKYHAVFGFVSGFFATIIFHQVTLSILWWAGLAPFPPYSMNLTHPFYIPAVFSLSFWGGLWGIVFALLQEKFPKDTDYWIFAFLFGGIIPSLVALLIVFPVKGLPFAGGGDIRLLLTAFLINGAWGVGTAIILKFLSIGVGHPLKEKTHY